MKAENSNLQPSKTSLAVAKFKQNILSNVESVDIGFEAGFFKA